MKKNMFIEFTRIVFGSWWSVLGHTILFAIILLVFKDLLFFNTLVSIEAIYIGIFILMAEFREQKNRNILETNRRHKDRQLVREDVSLTHTVMDEIKAIKKHQQATSKSIEEIRNQISNNVSNP